MYVFPKQPRLKKTKSNHTISTVSPATTSTTTSITTSAPTIFPRNHVAKRPTQITVPKRHASTLSPFISTDIRLKRHKKSPLPFEHHRTSHTTHPTTSSTSTATTTKNPPNTKILTTPEQSTSTAPIYNTPTTIINTTTPTTTVNSTNPTTPTTTINTTIPTATINTTTTTQTEIPSLMELNISLPPRLCTPSTSLTIPLPSSTPSSLIFPRTLQELRQSGLLETPPPCL